MNFEEQQETLRKNIKSGNVSAAELTRLFDSYKKQGDTSFKTINYDEAIHYYSMALICREDTVTFANRSLAHFKMENYSAALADGQSSVQLDTSYVKGYYRIGVCEFALHNYEKAIEAFTRLLLLQPTESGARQQLAAARKAFRDQQFARALSADNDNDDSNSSAPTLTGGFGGFGFNKTAATKPPNPFDRLNWDLPIPTTWTGPQPNLKINYMDEKIYTDGSKVVQVDGHGVKILSEKYPADFVKASVQYLAGDNGRTYPKIFVHHILKDFTDLMRNMPTVVDYSIPTMDDIDCTEDDIKIPWSDDEDDDNDKDDDETETEDEEKTNDDKDVDSDADGMKDDNDDSKGVIPTKPDESTDMEDGPSDDLKTVINSSPSPPIDDSMNDNSPSLHETPEVSPIDDKMDDKDDSTQDDSSSSSSSSTKMNDQDEPKSATNDTTTDTTTTTKKGKKQRKNRKQCRVYTPGRLNVCGDTHGQFWDLLNIFAIQGYPSPLNPYLFNGDYVDRGSFGYELVLTLMLYKLHCPLSMHMTRGNHETINMNRSFGFYGEVMAKADGLIFDCFTSAFNTLPLAYVLGNQVLILHGGLFSDDDASLADLRKIDRFRQPPENGGLMVDCLWSDPHPFFKGRRTSVRGAGCQFGSDITRTWLQRNGLNLLVRSHEMKHNGFEVTHDGKLITIFSAPNYCVSGDTSITLLNGTSMNINTISQSNPTTVLSFDTDLQSNTAQTTQGQYRINQGYKDCIELQLQDGRIITCTPDHSILVLRDGEYQHIQAQDLILNQDQIVLSAQGVDITHDHCNYDDIDLNTFSLDLSPPPTTTSPPLTQFDTNTNKEKLYAFFRILGHLLSTSTLPSSITASSSIGYSIQFQHDIDTISFLEDIKLIFDTQLESTYNTITNTHYITLSQTIIHQLLTMGFDIESTTLPTMLTLPTTPLPLIREFVASYFSQIAHEPTFIPESNQFSPLSITIPSTSTIVFDQWSQLLLQLGCINATITQSNSTINIIINDIQQYYTKIGFRHSMYKLSRLAIASTFLQYQQFNQHETTTCLDFLTKTGAIQYFNQTSQQQQEFTTLPTWTLSIISRQQIDEQLPTYDLSINQTHLFIANGMVVHNCDTMGNKGAIMTFDSKYSYTFKQFDAVNHPPIRAMFYCENFIR